MQLQQYQRRRFSLSLQLSTKNVTASTILVFLILSSFSLNLSDGFSIHVRRRDAVGTFHFTTTRKTTTCTQTTTIRQLTNVPSDNTDKTTTTIEKVLKVLDLANQFGPVGARRSDEDQQTILDAALEIVDGNDTEKSSSSGGPANVPLTGIHTLLYSAAPGASSGKLGPFFDGVVTQEFVNDIDFINAVELGPIRIELCATREIKSPDTFLVTFQSMSIVIFGNVKVMDKKPISGGGTWKVLFADTILESSTNRQKLVRIMQAPSLFVLEQQQ